MKHASHLIFVATLSTLAVSCIAHENGEYFDAPMEALGATAQEINTSGLALDAYDHPGYPNTIIEGQKFELASMKLKCPSPVVGCGSGSLPLRQVRLTVTSSQPIDLGQVGIFVNGVAVDPAQYWSSMVFPAENPSPLFDVGQTSWANLPAQKVAMIFISAKFPLLGNNDVLVKVGDVVTVTANGQKVLSGTTVNASIPINSQADPIGPATYQFSSGNPPFTVANKVWFVDVDPGAAVLSWHAPFMIKTPASSPNWYAWVAASTVYTTSTAP